MRSGITIMARRLRALSGGVNVAALSLVNSAPKPYEMPPNSAIRVSPPFEAGNGGDPGVIGSTECRLKVGAAVLNNSVSLRAQRRKFGQLRLALIEIRLLARP
jgi:hypothetical protein